MPGIKLAIIGAGSSYTPELIEGIAKKKDKLPIQKISLMDINENRLKVMTAFCQRYLAYLGCENIEVEATTDRRKAIEGADFIDLQIRVGGNKARINDEKIPLKYGLVGQETTGAGGFMKALRTIPVMLEIAKDIESCSPEAWVINYTNPSGLITEALTKHSKLKIAGFCSIGILPQVWARDVLGAKPEEVRYDYVGLNHLNFAFNIKINGRPISEAELIKIGEAVNVVDIELIKALKMLPAPYLQYYYHTSKVVKELKEAPKTRGEIVQDLEREVFSAYKDEHQFTKPEALAKRGGGGYSEVAMGFMNAIYNDEDHWMIVNVPNQGAIKFLPDDAVVEIGCLVNKTGIHPLVVEKIPSAIWGLIAAVKNYETLAVEAAVTGDRTTALLALVAHPLVRDYNLAKPLLDELVEANRNYLPTFFKD
mgnify:CR=1 FL=1|jgi:6-phospho-beta-glucosidase